MVLVITLLGIRTPKAMDSGSVANSVAVGGQSAKQTGQMIRTRTQRLTQRTPVEQPTQAIGAERLKARLQKMEEPARATFLQSASTLKPRLKHTERTP